jgi:hypothetical protein
VLNVRLAELREVALVQMQEEGYALTPLGKWAKALDG